MFMNPCSKFCYNHSSFSLSLSPHLPSWKIKGRVVQKTGVQLYKNQKGRGRYFHFVLQDTSGKIQVTAYNNEVHLYFDTVKLNEVYSLSGAVLKQTNPVYPSLTNHAYALTLNVSSNLRLLTANDEQCPAIEYNFMRIDLIQRLSGKNTVDVIGVCVHCSELAIVESSRGQRARRELVLMDQSKASIKLVMYDDIAIHFAWNPLEPIVVSARNAQVSANDDFLIVSNLTTLEINPSMDKAFTLLGWYNRIGKNLPSAGQEQVALRNCITIEHIRLEKFDDQASKRFTINGLIDKISGYFV